MAVENIFEYATRNKLRFPYKGSISVEDLWDLTPASLDSIYKVLNKQVKQEQEESLLTVKQETDSNLDVQIAIIKYIVSTKLQEKEAHMKAAAMKQRRDELAAIISEKETQALKDLPVDELRKMLQEVI